RFCAGDTFSIAAAEHENYSYRWEPAEIFANNITPVVKAIAVLGKVPKLHVTDQWGCTASDSVNISTDPCCLVTLPNAFTPNHDGRNDLFRIITAGYQEIERFVVLNRFGEIVFETNNQSEGWDGTYKGVPAEVGTYGYLHSYRCADGTKMQAKGDVTLLR